MFLNLDPVYWIMLAPALLLGLWAQMRVKSAFTVSGVGVTKGAREAIEKAGGKVVEASA